MNLERLLLSFLTVIVGIIAILLYIGLTGAYCPQAEVPPACYSPGGEPLMAPGLGLRIGPPWTMGGPYDIVSAPRSVDYAINLFRGYVNDIGDDLKVSEVIEFQHSFYAVVVERDTGVGAFELLLWKGNWKVMPEPGPNIMWNLKYGMKVVHATGRYKPGISSERARQVAIGSLSSLFPGFNVSLEEVIPFYGYYLIYYSANRSIRGIMSVNAFTEQVWYHTWHGHFIRMKQLDGES